MLFDKILRNTTRMNRLINDVLTLSRVAQAEITLHPTALRPLIQETIDQHPQLHPSKASIDLGELGTVLGDEISLVQVISNLLNNAVKFVPGGVKPEVKVWSERHGDSVRLCVQDNGIGIKPELQGNSLSSFSGFGPRTVTMEPALVSPLCARPSSEWVARLELNPTGRTAAAFG